MYIAHVKHTFPSYMFTLLVFLPRARLRRSRRSASAGQQDQALARHPPHLTCPSAVSLAATGSAAPVRRREGESQWLDLGQSWFHGEAGVV